MTQTITTSLVGAHFRPPAKALLACLPAGHPLHLRPEPTNEYDENAVQVLLASSSIPTDEFIRDELETQLAGQGYDLETVLGEAEWHLGYLPKAAKGNAELESWQIGVQKAIHEFCQSCPQGTTLQATLTFDSAGKPALIIPWPPVPTSSPQAGDLSDETEQEAAMNDEEERKAHE